jgi:hypothetical protein
MLSSNQSFREQRSSDYSDIKRENRAHRKDTLEAIEGNQRLLVEVNLNFLKEVEQMVNEQLKNIGEMIGNNSLVPFNELNGRIEVVLNLITMKS